MLGESKLLRSSRCSVGAKRVQRSHHPRPRSPRMVALPLFTQIVAFVAPRLKDCNCTRDCSAGCVIAPLIHVRHAVRRMINATGNRQARFLPAILYPEATLIARCASILRSLLPSCGGTGCPFLCSRPFSFADEKFSYPLQSAMFVRVAWMTPR